MTATAQHLSKTAADTLCKKDQQMKHMQKRFLENCRTYVQDKPVTSLSIAVALGRQDSGLGKVVGFMSGKLMRPRWLPTGKPEPQAKTKTPTPLEDVQIVDLGSERLLGLVLGPDDACGQTGTGSRIRSAALASNGVPPITGERPRPMPGSKTTCV